MGRGLESLEVVFLQASGQAPGMLKHAADPTIAITAKEHRFLGLDALRGVAAMCVVLWHVGQIFGGNRFFGHANLAVDFFFLLSGFVISHAYKNRLANGSLDFGDYLSRRIVRLYPLIVFGAISGFLIAVITAISSLRQALIELPLAMLAIPLPERGGEIAPLNPPAWSLFFELIGSIAFGLFARWLTTRRLMALVGISAVVFVIWSLITGQQNLGVNTERFWGGFPRLSATFFGGVLLQHLHARKWFRHNASPWSLALVLIATFIPSHVPGDTLYRLTLVLIIYPAIVLLGANFSQGGGLWRSAMIVSGDISYPLYIVHWPVFLWVLAGYTALHLNYHSHGRFYGAMAAAAATSVAWAAFRLYDVPVRASLAKVLRRRSHK